MFCERGTIFLRELFDITKFDLYKEEFAPDRTILILEFIKKQATKTSDKNKRQKQTIMLQGYMNIFYNPVRLKQRILRSFSV